MAFLLFQAGTSLQILNQSGTLSTLTLPTGVTLDSTKIPRFALFDRYVVMVNSPSVPITIDDSGIVRPLCPKPPEKTLTLDDDGGVGGLTGDYKARQTFVIRDVDGNIIAESDYSPVMETAFAASANTLDAEGLNISQEDISGSRIVRTLSGGSVYYRWIDVDGNTATQSDSDDTADAALSIIAAPILGTPPSLTLVAQWRSRLWGVDRVDFDHLRYSEAGVMYSWPPANDLLIGRAGSDTRGVTALIPRRDALGIGRREGLFQVTGTSNTDFRVIILTENIGVESQQSVVVWKDIAYFLWKDGVYRWGPEGVKCLSEGKVESWFQTDTYFNRARFQYAFAAIDPINEKYRLCLAATGSNTEDHWIEYDIVDGTWWGPHKTDAFTTPTCALDAWDVNDNFLILLADSTGYFWKDDATTAADNAITGIALDVNTKYYDGNTPDIEKLWGELSMIGKVQSAGTLTITPKTGYLNVRALTPISYDMAKGRQRLRRLGTGKMIQLNFTHSTAGEPVELYGFTVPFFEVGRR